MKSSELKKQIARFPRVDLISRPTPFRKLGNLTKTLGGPEIYIKRDDLTGMAFGGNKSRKLEFIISDMIEKKCDVVITWASLQSNWCLQTAAAARKFGIKPILLLFAGAGQEPEFDGNLLLDLIVDAEIVVREAEKGKVVTRRTALNHMEDILERVREWGHTPYLAPIGGSMAGDSMEMPLGAVGYVEGYRELHDQAEDLGISIDYVILASGSGGTQAGLIVGAKVLEKETRVLGISVSEEKSRYAQDIFTIVQDTEKALELDSCTRPEDVIVFDEYLQKGYGYVTAEVCEALRLTAVEEGIYLDPVYTGKAMFALIDLIKKGYFNKDDRIVFMHTGGTAAIFPYRKDITAFLK